MITATRRSLIRGSLAFAAAGSLARPYLANAAATTASMWLAQGFIPEEDAAYRALVADYQKASGNTIDYSIIPFAPLRQKAVSAVAAGVVPDLIETADFNFLYLNAWKNNFVDVTDVFETQKEHWSKNAHDCSFAYNNVAKKRSYYQVPWKSAAVPFRFWRSLVEKSGQNVADVPKTWDAFNDFFRPVQDGLKKEGMRNVYGMGYQLTATGVDPINLFNAFTLANGGELVDAEGQLQTGDPRVKEAAIKATTYLAKSFTDGYVPPVVLNWNDSDDNNAFHAKLMVMDFDGSLSTEVALYHDKEQYNDIVTYGLPLSNDGKKVPAQVNSFGVAIPQGAKNVPVAKEFMRYFIEPKVLNTQLKASLGRWVIPFPAMAKSDPFWLDPADPHRATYVSETLFGPTIPIYESRNPGMGPVGAENVMMNAVINVMKNGMTPQAAIEAAFKRAETIVAKFPIAAS
jgi:multiple sugar transport system substrate-binding protein